MARLDRLFAQLRAEAMTSPLTKAGGAVLPALSLAGNIHIGLSINK